MNYALIKNETVTNIIWLHPMNASDFPSAVPTNDLPVQIGDTYKDGKFYHNGEEITPTPEVDSYQQGYDQAVLDCIEGGIL